LTDFYRIIVSQTGRYVNAKRQGRARNPVTGSPALS